MAPEDLNSPSNQDDSCTNRNRLNLNSDEEYLALCLLMISLGNEDPNSSEGENSPTLPLPVLDPSYKCRFCGETFLSYQALGGHMSIHRKSVPWVADQSLIPTDQNSCTNSRGRTHDCSICHKSFKTGMALGGHMRCHKKEREGGSSSALAFEFDLNQSSVGTEVAKNQQSESESRGVRFASEFDLNLPASPELGLGVEESEKKKMEEEEEEEVESPLAAKKPRFFEFFK